jgi:hypothetical protein
VDDAGRIFQIRELAGTRRLVEDDIKTRLGDANQRGLAKRRVRALEELTSRKSGTDIPKILERLEAISLRGGGFELRWEARFLLRSLAGSLDAANSPRSCRAVLPDAR